MESIKKIDGPEIALDSVRVIDFGNQDPNQQVLLQPLNTKGAMSISGTYQCDVSLPNKEIGYSRHIEIIMHGRTLHKTHTNAYTHKHTNRAHQPDMELLVICFPCTVCIEKVCPAQQDVTNGSITMNGYVPGSCYTVTCDKGYLLRGSFAHQCSDEGTWTGLEPVCGKLYRLATRFFTDWPSLVSQCSIHFYNDWCTIQCWVLYMHFVVNHNIKFAGLKC